MPSTGPGFRRSYPTGRRDYSRAYIGRPFDIVISMDAPAAGEVRVRLETTLNADDGHWDVVPFEQIDERTFQCRVIPQRLGFFAFCISTSPDGGATWMRDAVPDAWLLIDPPQVDGLRLYTLIPTVSGDIQAWTADLDRIKQMGFNAVHLLPITRQDTSQSPYSARDLFEVDDSYLSASAKRSGLQQLEKFVRRAKELGLRLCFDLVLNHVGVHSTIATRAPEWIVPDAGSPDGHKRAGYWCDAGWCTWDDLVLINFAHGSETVRSEIWHYMTQYALFWARFAHETGGFVRLDNLHGSDQEFMHTVTRSMREHYPQLAILAEYFADDETLLTTVPEWGLNLVLATPWSYKFVPDLRRHLRNLHHLSDRVRHFTPVNSHDSGSPAQEFGSVESTVPRYVAAALLGTGVTGITQGVEWGVAEKIEFVGRSPRLVPPKDAPYTDFITAVNVILASQEAFRHGGSCAFVDNDHDAILAAFRRDPAMTSHGFLVVCNFDIAASQQISCDLTPFFDRSVLRGRELLGGRAERFETKFVSLVLPPCGAMVWELTADAH